MSLHNLSIKSAFLITLVTASCPSDINGLYVLHQKNTTLLLHIQRQHPRKESSVFLWDFTQIILYFVHSQHWRLYWVGLNIFSQMLSRDVHYFLLPERLIHLQQWILLLLGLKRASLAQNAGSDLLIVWDPFKFELPTPFFHTLWYHV